MKEALEAKAADGTMMARFQISDLMRCELKQYEKVLPPSRTVRIMTQALDALDTLKPSPIHIQREVAGKVLEQVVSVEMLAQVRTFVIPDPHYYSECLRY